MKHASRAEEQLIDQTVQAIEDDMHDDMFEIVSPPLEVIDLTGDDCDLPMTGTRQRISERNPIKREPIEPVDIDADLRILSAIADYDRRCARFTRATAGLLLPPRCVPAPCVPSPACSFLIGVSTPRVPSAAGAGTSRETFVLHNFVLELMISADPIRQNGSPAASRRDKLQYEVESAFLSFKLHLTSTRTLRLGSENWKERLRTNPLKTRPNITKPTSTLAARKMSC